MDEGRESRLTSGERSDSGAPLKLEETVGGFWNRRDRKFLREALSPGERLRVVVEASRKAPRLGLLAVTDQRLLYVEERAFLRPVVISINLGDVLEVGARSERAAPTLVVKSRDGSIRRFTHVMPTSSASEVLALINQHVPPPTIANADSDLFRRHQGRGLPRRAAWALAALGLALCTQFVSSTPLDLLLVTLAAGCAGIAVAGLSRDD